MKKNILLILGIILIAVIFERILSMTDMFEHLELMSYDLRSRIATDSGLFGKKFNHADRDVVIVAIDDYSREQIKKNPRLDLGPWPWPRDVWSEVIDFIEDGEPTAILVDLVFENLNENSWNDRRFAQELRQYDNIVLGTYLDNPKILAGKMPDNVDTEENDYIPTTQPLNVTVDDKKLDDAITYYTHAPVHDIYTESNTMGVVNKVLDKDSVVRKTQPIYKLVKNNETYYMPSLSFAGFLKYMGDVEDIVIKDNKILYKGRVIPVDDEGVVNISWHNLGRSYSYIPISKLILNRGESGIDSDYFKDKFVIIGRTESGKGIDLSSADSSYTGPEATAVALDNFMNDSNVRDKKARKFVSELSKPLEYLLIIISCILVAFVGMHSKSAFIGCLNGFLSILVYLFFCFWLFASPTSRVWVPIVVPLYYLSLTSGIVFAYRFYKEMTKKSSIMNMFGKFVSPKVLATLMKNPNDVVLKNTRKHITVLFCDVKDFASLSEKYNPEKLIDNLNELFKEIVNIIFENNGTVDKFIGDCIMAYWGDLASSEDDAYMAVKTALEIKKKVDELKVSNAKENKIIFDVKIGINTGEALLGLAGTDKIMSYTAMGDAVNVASRLESSCSKLNRDILISKSTYNEAKAKIVVLEVGEISVKGKEERIEVYEPIGLNGTELNMENND